MNTTPHPETSSRRLTRTVLDIADLPSAPTFDWATKAAQTLIHLHPNTTFGVVITLHNLVHNRLSIESSGVCQSHPLNSPIETDLARCPLDRLGTSPLKLTPHEQAQGLVTTAARLLPHWHASIQSDPWNISTAHPTLAAYAPLESSPPSPDQTPRTTHNSALPFDAHPTAAILVLASQNNRDIPPLSPTLLADAVSALTHKARETIHRQGNNTILWLTQREQAILDQLIIGRSVRTIAESIGRSPHTVHDHVKNLHRKLGASSRGQLIASALGHTTSTNPTELINPLIDPELIHQPTQAAHPGVVELKLANETPSRPKATPLNRASAVR